MKKIFHGIEIVRFRQFDRLKLENLAAVNMLVGPNNSGKTSVLEAIALLCNPVSFENWFSVAWEREIKSSRASALESLKWLFPAPKGQPGSDLFSGEIEINFLRYNTPEPRFVLRATFQEKITFDSDQGSAEPIRSALVCLETRTEQLPVSKEPTTGIAAKFQKTLLDSFEYIWRTHKENAEFRYDRNPAITDTPHFNAVNCQMVTTVSHRTKHEPLHQLSAAVESGQKGAVRDGLRLLDSTITDLDIVAPGNGRTVVKISRSTRDPSPLASEGDGLRRLLGLTAAAVAATNGVLLVDEIEAGIHTGALIPSFRYLVKLCESLNVQIFVTTHSLEAVDALLDGMGEQPDNAAVFRLPPVGSDVPVKRIAGNVARSLRENLGSDLR